MLNLTTHIAIVKALIQDDRKSFRQIAKESKSQSTDGRAG